MVAVALIGCFALPAESVRPKSVDASAKRTQLIPLKRDAPAARLSAREAASAEGAPTPDARPVARTSPRKLPEQRFGVGPFVPAASTKKTVAVPVSRGRVVREKEVTSAFVVRATVTSPLCRGLALCRVLGK